MRSVATVVEYVVFYFVTGTGRICVVESIEPQSHIACLVRTGVVNKCIVEYLEVGNRGEGSLHGKIETEIFRISVYYLNDAEEIVVYPDVMRRTVSIGVVINPRIRYIDKLIIVYFDVVAL